MLLFIISVQINVKGNPLPSATWKRNDQELIMTSRINFNSTEKSSALTINDADLGGMLLHMNEFLFQLNLNLNISFHNIKSKCFIYIFRYLNIKYIRNCFQDAGIYNLHLENPYGSKVVPVVVRVLDKPAVPSGPVEFTNVTADSLVLSWRPPFADGGSNVNNYLVEIREKSGDDTEWRLLSGSTTRTTLKVPRLKTGMDYAFRIKAENRFGVGKPLESATVRVKYPFKVSNIAVVAFFHIWHIK